MLAAPSSSALTTLHDGTAWRSIPGPTVQWPGRPSVRCRCGGAHLLPCLLKLLLQLPSLLLVKQLLDVILIAHRTDVRVGGIICGTPGICPRLKAHQVLPVMGSCTFNRSAIRLPFLAGL